MSQVIKDRLGRTLATIEVQLSGDKIIRDRLGRILGRYEKQSDLTRDRLGRIVARGDALTMLIER